MLFSCQSVLRYSVFKFEPNTYKMKDTVPPTPEKEQKEKSMHFLSVVSITARNKQAIYFFQNSDYF